MLITQERKTFSNGSGLSELKVQWKAVHLDSVLAHDAAELRVRRLGSVQVHRPLIQ